MAGLLEKILAEHITISELKIIEEFADDLFQRLNIDVVFTRHFYDRLNDIRNKKDIEVEELINIFKKFFVKYHNRINIILLEKDATLKDINTHIE